MATAIHRSASIRSCCLRTLPCSGPGDVRLGDEPPAAVLAAVLSAEFVDHLAAGDGHQDPPEVVAVVEPWESPLSDAFDDRIEGAERHVLLIFHRFRGPRCAKPRADPGDKPREIV